MESCYSPSIFKMFRLVVLTVLVALASAAFLPTLDNRIVGGQKVEIKDYPYQVSLQYFGNHICGGSIVSSKFVITAAHCTYRQVVGLLSIRAGSSERGTGGTVVGVKAIRQHPDYNRTTLDYDISILELATELKFSNAINKVDLPSANKPIPSGTTTVVTGWGLTGEGGIASKQLKMVEVNVVSNEKCNEAYNGEITDRMICAGVPEGGKDACQGDSGGPLVADGRLVGVISWGNGCARPNIPSVYSNVANLREFIDTTTGL